MKKIQNYRLNMVSIAEKKIHKDLITLVKILTTRGFRKGGRKNIRSILIQLAIALRFLEKRRKKAAVIDNKTIAHQLNSLKMTKSIWLYN